MAQEEKNEDFKIKTRFLIKLDSRPEEKQILFTKWLNAQTNPQSSFLSLIEHMIDRFGIKDVTDHNVARALFNEMILSQDNSAKNKADEGPEAIEKEEPAEIPEQPSSNNSKQESKKNVKKFDPKAF